MVSADEQEHPPERAGGGNATVGHAAQRMVLSSLYGWRFQGRKRAAPVEKAGTVEPLEDVPVFLLQAELHGTGIDVAATIDLLSAKRLLRKRKRWAQPEGSWILPDGRVLTVEVGPRPPDRGPLVLVSSRGRVTVGLDGQVIFQGGTEDQCLDLTREGIELVEASPEPETQRRSGRKRRGRPPMYDPKDDQRVLDAWSSGHYRNYADLARELNTTRLEVKRAIDRVRHRASRTAE